MTDSMTTLPRALVAGGAGFLGAHLCRRLLLQGWEVICVDNFHTGRRENLAGLAAHPGLTVIRQDIALPLPAELHIDCIYNLACPASPVHYQADPVATLQTCVQGATQLLELAARTGARILQASTSEVYGDPLEHPQREGYWGHVNPVGPRSCYDEGKRCAETLFMEYGRRRGVVVKIARIFNTYGPGMAADDGRVVSNFIVQALAGHPLTVYGDGSQTRSFCYVDDLVDGLLCLMNSPDQFSQPVNLGNPAEISVLRMAELVRELTGSRAPLQFRDLPRDDPTHRCPDITLAREQLRWRPITPLSAGLARTVDYFRRQAHRAPAPTAAMAAGGMAGA